MKQILFISLMLLSALHVTSQEQNVDSLINVLNTQKLPVVKRLDLYDRISSYYSDKNTEKSLLYGNTGLQLAEKEKDKVAIASICASIGTALLLKSSLDSSLLYLQRSVILAQEIQDNEIEARATSNMGSLYTLLNENEKALDCYLKSMTLYETIKNEVETTRLLINISSLYQNLGQDEKALHYLKQAQEHLKTIDNPRLETAAYQLMGGVFLKMKEYDKALENMLIAFDLSCKNQLIRYQVITTQYLAGIYNDGFQDYEKAERYAKECVSIAESVNSEDLLITARNILTKVYVDARKFKEGRDVALKIWDIDSTRMTSAINTAYNLAVCYLYLEEKDKALYFFEKRNELKNELNKKEFLNSISDMEIKYETEKKELRITSLEKERQLYICLGIAGILLAVVLAIVLRQKIKNAKREKQLIATRSVLDGEMGERTRLARDLHDDLLEDACEGLLEKLKRNNE